LNRILTIFGIVFLIAGIVITPWAVLVRAVEPLSDLYGGEPELNSWSISANYSAQQRLIVKMAVGKDWAMFAEPTDEYKIGTGIPTAVLVVPITILDPKGGKTKADVVYIAHESEGQLQRNLYPFLAKVQHNDGGLSFEESYIQRENGSIIQVAQDYPVDGQFLGVTSYEGKYEVTIDKTLPNPPSTLTLLKQRIRFVQPYLLIAPIGGVLIACGAFALVRARKRAERGSRLQNATHKK
jgi:hypothetical protein